MDMDMDALIPDPLYLRAIGAVNCTARSAGSYTIHGTITTFRYIMRYWNEINVLSRRPSVRTILLTGLVCYGVAELNHYWTFAKRYHRFNGIRVANYSRKQLSQVVDQLILRNPGIFERLSRYSTSAHITDKDSLIDSMFIDTNTSNIPPATQQNFGSSALFRQYKPVFYSWIRRTLYHAGTIAMRRTGYIPRIHITEIGDYTVWTRNVPNTKPIVMFPGFGLGAIPYYNVMCHFGRTVHIIELPNLGFNTPQDAPGYMTSDTVYRVVRAHVGEEPHDIMAHSLGSSPAAHYINHQHIHETTPPNQTAVICDGFVCPVDSIVSHIYPCVDYSMYRELMKYRVTTVSWREFSKFLWFVTHDLDVTVFTKRFHNFYQGILWRDDYKTNIRYVFGERDIFYDVPFIKNTVMRSYIEREKYLFIPKGRHGACFFGKRRSETLKHIENWMTYSRRNRTKTVPQYRSVIPLGRRDTDTSN